LLRENRGAKECPMVIELGTGKDKFAITKKSLEEKNDFEKEKVRSSFLYVLGFRRL